MRITQVAAKQLKGSREEVTDTLVSFIEQVSFVLNGNTDIIDNLKVELHEVNFNLPPNNEADVRHTLGRLARGYIAVRLTRSCLVFDGSTDWNAQSIFVKSTSFGKATLLVF